MRLHRIVYLAFAGFVVGIGIWWGLGGVLNTPTAEPSVTSITLREFQAQRSQTLAQLLAGKPTVVNIWASWCAPCRAEMPLLVQAQKDTQGVQFVFVNQGESDAVIATYLQRSGLAMKNIWSDEEGALRAAVGSAGLPTTIFFNAQGQRVDVHLGVLNARLLQAQLQRLQAQ